ncbi:MAG: tRNA pseudouridine(38-40) synthase TruA [Saccharofermentanales bacterium]
MYNIALLVEYDGTGFCGWQSQKNGKSIQDALQNAIFILTGEKINLYGCSRTDAGVHAAGHVSNFHSSMNIPIQKIPIAMNSHLPLEISVKKAAYVDEKFHARFDATGKRYRYSIWNETARPALYRNFNYHTPRKIDIDLMRKASEKLTGTWDFAAFMASGSETVNTVRSLDNIEIDTFGPQINMIFTGDGFLYNMVRILAGTLFYVGIGKIDITGINDIIISKDRRKAGKTLPACGLTLEKVFYENDIFCSEGLWDF